MYVPEEELAGDEAARVKAVSAMVTTSVASVRVLVLHGDTFGLAHRAGKAGPIADLILLGDIFLWESPWLRQRAAETIIMGGGTPLLVLSGATQLSPVRHAAIGWKDTPEARRAIHDLIAVIEPDAKVSVISIARDDAEEAALSESAAEVVRHLDAHGFEAAAHVLPDNGQSDADALEGFALRHGAELLAIGAFGHSRLREVMFGGVTRALIAQPRLPVLLSR